MTESYTIIRRFPFQLVGTISLDRNYHYYIYSNKLTIIYVLSGLYLNALKTEKILQFLGREIPDVRHFSASG